MKAFFHRIWPFVRPYKGRLLLGLFCGIIYALTNGALVIVIRLVIDLVFSGSAEISVAKKLENAPAFLHPLIEHLIHWLPRLQSPSSNFGLVLVISSIPAVMLLRCVSAYLNVYLMNWSAMRAVADLRTRLFGHLNELSLDFFSQARTGDLIARLTSDTQLLYGIIGGSPPRPIPAPRTVLLPVPFPLCPPTRL